MFGNSRKIKATKIDSLVGRNTELHGDVHFSGGLHVDGVIKGNVISEPGSVSVLTLSAHGTVEGEVKVPNVVLNGVVIGDVYVSEHVDLQPNARVTGNVYYSLIEMAMGAEVNGSLVHHVEPENVPMKFGKTPPLDLASEGQG